MSASGYAVVDLETTGLSPGRNDRIVEIGVILLDADGTVRNEWSTVVNPERDLGPTHVHGIYGRHAKAAPRFSDISDELIDVLDGRTLVAHNAGFDARFLAAEWARAGSLREAKLPFEYLCTMRMAKSFLPGSGRTLVDCCAAFDIEISGAHSALGDARATSELLRAYRAADPAAAVWASRGLPVVNASSLGRLGVRAPVLPREVAVGRASSAVDDVPSDSILERIGGVMPADEAASANDDEYLAMLDICLEDHLLTVTEADSLATLALQAGISDARRRELHERYFEAAVTTAWADQELTAGEIAQLEQLAHVLEISEAQVAEARKPRSGGRRARPTAADDTSSPATDDVQLVPGDQVVLTGTMRRDRDAWKGDIAGAGFLVHPAVTKKTRVLIAADPDSLSGKARKARQYGIPIVDESWLERRFAAAGR